MIRKLSLLLFALVAYLANGYAQSFDEVHQPKSFYFSIGNYYLLDTNAKYSRDAKTAWTATVGYTFTKRIGLEFSGGTLGNDWESNPHYVALDAQLYSLTKNRVRVVTSFGLSVVDGRDITNKYFIKPTFNLGASLQYLCTKTSYVGLNFRRMEGRKGFNAFMMGVSFGGYF